MFVVLVIVIAAIFFSVGLLTNGDPLWFLPVFNARALRIVVHQPGCTVELREGDAGYEELTGALNASFTQVEGFNSTFGISPESLEQYRTQERALEVFYAEPVTIHAPYRFGHPDAILIPLSGHFADTRSVFGGHDGDYWSGALRLKSTESIARVLEKIPCPPTR
jgi:hypothetical protein